VKILSIHGYLFKLNNIKKTTLILWKNRVCLKTLVFLNIIFVFRLGFNFDFPKVPTRFIFLSNYWLYFECTNTKKKDCKTNNIYIESKINYLKVDFCGNKNILGCDVVNCK